VLLKHWSGILALTVLKARSNLPPEYLCRGAALKCFRLILEG
jgi:hypothetical protein